MVVGGRKTYVGPAGGHVGRLDEVWLEDGPVAGIDRSAAEGLQLGGESKDLMPQAQSNMGF